MNFKHDSNHMQKNSLQHDNPARQCLAILVYNQHIKEGHCRVALGDDQGLVV